MKIINSLKDGGEILKKNNISSYKIDCEILMSQTLNISREEVLLNLGRNIKKEEKEEFFNLIYRRRKNEPIAYIINNKDFWKDKFITDKNVLIPRPDSEHLVEQTLRLIKKDQMINTINASECVVEVEFRVGTIPYKVVRCIKPNKFQIYKNNKLINQDFNNFLVVGNIGKYR